MIAEQNSYLSDLSDRFKNFEVASEPFNIVFHGHSIPCGYTVNKVVRASDAYPQLVKDALNIRFPNMVMNAIVTGVGGEAAVQGEKRIKTVIDHNPLLVTIDFGRNDVFVPLTQTRDAWSRMTEALLARGTKVLLLTPAPDDGSLYYPLEKKKADDQEIADMIRNVASQYQVGCADVAAAFCQLLRGHCTPSDYLASVNHPNRLGHEIIAREIMRWIPTVF